MNIREEKKVVTGKYFARSEWESLLGFTASGLASAGNGHYGHEEIHWLQRGFQGRHNAAQPGITHYRVME